MKKILLLGLMFFALNSFAQFRVTAPTTVSLHYGRMSNNGATTAQLDISATYTARTFADYSGFGVTANASTGTYTVVNAGLYSFQYYQSYGSRDDDLTAQLFVNGTAFGDPIVGQVAGAGTGVSYTYTFPTSAFTAGQTVQIRVLGVTADAIDDQNRAGVVEYFNCEQKPSAVAPVIDAVAEYGEQILASTPIVNTTADITNGTFTLPSAGVWDVEYFVFAATIGGNETATVFVTDPSNIVVPNSYGRTGTVPTPAGNTGNMVSQKVRIITTGATNYKLRATTAGTQVTLAAGGATSKVSWTKIAGFLPTTGITDIPNSPNSTLQAIAITNRSAGGQIGSAATTVNINSAFNVSQTTTGQTLILPNPTAGVPSRLVSVSNTGSASFTMYGNIISVGESRLFVWTGVAWNIVA